MGVAKLRNAKRWRKSGPMALLVCAAGFVVAFVLRYLLSPLVNEYMTMLFFAINCIVMSYFYGYGYSLGLLLVSTPTALIVFRKPYFQIDTLADSDLFTILVYGSIVMLASGIIEWLQRERYSAVLQQRVSETRYQMLIETDQARRAEYAEHFAAMKKAQEAAAAPQAEPGVK